MPDAALTRRKRCPSRQSEKFKNSHGFRQNVHSLRELNRIETSLVHGNIRTENKGGTSKQRYDSRKAEFLDIHVMTLRPEETSRERPPGYKARPVRRSSRQSCSGQNSRNYRQNTDDLTTPITEVAIRETGDLLTPCIRESS